MASETSSRGASSARRMIIGHEALAESVAQVGALAAQGFGQEMAGRAGDVEHGRVKLHELHVAQLGAGAIGHGMAVGGGDRRVGRLAKELAGAAGRQHDGPRPHQGQARAGDPRPGRRGTVLRGSPGRS